MSESTTAQLPTQQLGGLSAVLNNNDPSDYKTHITAIFTNNKLTDAQASLKQIAKLLQGVNTTPKSRQIPTSNFIVKKFVLGLNGGKDLLLALGFSEITINNTQYFSLADDHPTVTSAGQIAADILTIAATNPLKTTPVADTAMTDGPTTDATKTDETKTDTVVASPTEKGEEEKKEPVVATPTPCIKGCGFYGTPATDNMCSSCHKNEQKKKNVLLPTTTTATTGAKPLLSNLKPLGRPLATNKNQCATPHCKFHIWKDAPEDWKQKLLDEWEGKTMTDGDDEKPATTTTATSDDGDATTSATSTQPQKFCQYCSYINTRKEFTTTNGPTTKTLNEKRALASLKIRAVGRMASKMRPVQLNKDRCWTCNRKLGISGTDCRCGFIFCGQHRYPATHDCQFDHLARQTNNLAKSVLNDIRTSKLEDDD